MRSCLYVGHVVHARLRPVAHRLRYSVFSILADLDELPDLDRSLRLLSLNRLNLFSLHERDHGDRKGALRAHIDGLLAGTAVDLGPGGRVQLLCYPRMLGFVFNPISVYFCETSAGELRAIIYEVSSTFGERRSYVLPVADSSGPIVHQESPKEMYVSPFNESDGHYSFHVRPPGAHVTVGILYRHDGEAVMRAHFAGERRALTDRALLGLACRLPFMTLKVVGAIHWEALKLWLKGLRMKSRRPNGKFAVSYGAGPREAAKSDHARLSSGT